MHWSTEAWMLLHPEHKDRVEHWLAGRKAHRQEDIDEYATFLVGMQRDGMHQEVAADLLQDFADGGADDPERYGSNRRNSTDITELSPDPDGDPNTRDIHVNEVEYKGYNPADDGHWIDGTPFIYDGGSNTIHLGQEGYYHTDIHQLAQHLYKGPIWQGALEQGNMGQAMEYRGQDKEKIRRALEKHLNTSIDGGQEYGGFSLG